MRQHGCLQPRVKRARLALPTPRPAATPFRSPRWRPGPPARSGPWRRTAPVTRSRSPRAGRPPARPDRPLPQRRRPSPASSGLSFRRDRLRLLAARQHPETRSCRPRRAVPVALIGRTRGAAAAAMPPFFHSFFLLSPFFLLSRFPPYSRGRNVAREKIPRNTSRDDEDASLSGRGPLRDPTRKTGDESHVRDDPTHGPRSFRSTGAGPTPSTG